MYISDKIVGFGDILNVLGNVIGQYVVIRSEDYPDEPDMRRTTYSTNPNRAGSYAAANDFSYSSHPGSGEYIGVEVSKLKEFRPAWCHTKDELLAQYEAMQRENGSGPIKNLDLRKDPGMLALAKKLWAERLAEKSKT